MKALVMNSDRCVELQDGEEARCTPEDGVFDQAYEEILLKMTYRMVRMMVMLILGRSGIFLVSKKVRDAKLWQCRIPGRVDLDKYDVLSKRGWELLC
jgi:hypothetical protein